MIFFGTIIALLVFVPFYLSGAPPLIAAGLGIGTALAVWIVLSFILWLIRAFILTILNAFSDHRQATR
jgi:hypothetical protein